MGDQKHERASQCGGCHCGAVRFETTGPERFVSYCHCESCRKTTGAVYSTWVGFKSDQVKWLNKPPAFYASSPGIKRGYCPACGTPLTFGGGEWADETHFLIGVFDDPEAFTPRTEVFVEEALSFAHFVPGKPL